MRINSKLSLYFQIQCATNLRVQVNTSICRCRRPMQQHPTFSDYRTYVVLLAILHWLRHLERVNFKLALMAYRVLHDMAPAYFNQLVLVSDLPTCQVIAVFSRHLRSFPVAAATVWNTLPAYVPSSPSIATFRQRLKTFLFH